jgi:hypothetical protein
MARTMRVAGRPRGEIDGPGNGRADEEDFFVVMRATRSEACCRMLIELTAGARTVEELCARIGASPSTVRRYLRELGAFEIVIRTTGGRGRRMYGLGPAARGFRRDGRRWVEVALAAGGAIQLGAPREGGAIRKGR